MNGWNVVVPIKPPGERKTRLRGYLTPRTITALTDRMLRHVLGTLRECPRVRRVTLLSAAPCAGWTGDWHGDEGAGLNPALDRYAAACPDRLMVIHADLPGLEAGDVAALIDAADVHGAAIAPDRHGTGTNALALRDARGHAFRFGPASFSRHAAMPGMAEVGGVVRRAGLSIDIDLPQDMRLAVRHGFLPRHWLPTADRPTDANDPPVRNAGNPAAPPPG